MRVGGLEETITVTGEAPVVDVQNVTQQVTLGKEVLDSIPVGRNQHNFANMIPGMNGPQDYAGTNTICTIAAGEAKYIYITTNANTAGTWGVIAFGIGSSAQNANALAGLGLVAIATTLNQSHPASTFPDAYTFTANDRAQTKVWVGGAGNVFLPLAADVGNNLFFIFKNNYYY